MIIYLDESGNLGFDFSLPGTSRFLIISCMICYTQEAILGAHRAVKLTRKNKLGKNVAELKGNNTSLAVKKYFYTHLEKNKSWEIITIATDKQALLKHRNKKGAIVDKNLFYDEVAGRLLSQINLSPDDASIHLIIDKSKNKNALKEFDNSIKTMIRSIIFEKRQLFIHHRSSQADPGLQIADLFSWGIYRKYQNSDHDWYDIFKSRIALEMEFKFEVKKKTDPVM